jgi:hypothetical protein
MKPNKSIPLNPIDNLFNSFSEIATNDLDEAITILKQKGIDSDKVVENGIFFINKLKAKAKIQIAVHDGKQKLSIATDLLRKKIQTLENPTQILKDILQGNFPSMAVNFSKLENININEVEEMLTEAQILEIIEALEKQDTN